MPLFCRSTIVQIYSFSRGNSNDRKVDFAINADDFMINSTYISVTVNLKTSIVWSRFGDATLFSHYIIY